jgi:hypothetical protein
VDPTPYVRLRPEDLDASAAIRSWVLAGPALLSSLGLPDSARLPIPLVGEPAEGGQAELRRRAREGLVSLLALDPANPRRTLYLELIGRLYPGLERTLERRVRNAFTAGRHRRALREAVALVNLEPGRAEARFNLGLLLSRAVAAEPDGPDSRRWRALARGEFARAAALAPELFWGHYHRGVLAYSSGLRDAAASDWVLFLDRYFADRPAPQGLRLPLLPLAADPQGAELPGLAYTVLLDLLNVRPSPDLEPVPAEACAIPAARG